MNAFFLVFQFIGNSAHILIWIEIKYFSIFFFFFNFNSQVLPPQGSEDDSLEQGLNRVPVSFGNDEQALQAAINDVAGRDWTCHSS